MIYQPRRRPALPLLAMLILHLLALWLLLQGRPRAPAAPAPSRVELRLIRPTRAQAPPQAAHVRALAPTPSRLPPAPGAISLPALAEAAGSAQIAPAASGPGESASAPPLDLALPRSWSPSQRPSPAAQAIHDPRANSPRPGAEQRMSAAIKGGDREVEWTRVETADGGAMLRGSNGACLRVVPNRAAALGLMDAPAKAGGCWSGEAGGVRHTRPR